MKKRTGKNSSRSLTAVFASIVLIVCIAVGTGALTDEDAADSSQDLPSAQSSEVGKDADFGDSEKQGDSEGKSADKSLTESIDSETPLSFENVAEYSGKAYTALNSNLPNFETERSTLDKGKSFESYSELDSLGRAGIVYAYIGKDLMPTGERGSIGQVKPTGWHTVKYDIVDGKYLYNRCHLIGWQLTAENANRQNLITGTRYMNVSGMLPFENMVADYIKETGNHVLYRVTPDFRNDELLARGVMIEAYSVEDNGDGICFNVYCYNVQPGVEIDYATGESKLK